MAKCNCAGSSCSCLIQVGNGLVIQGIGTAADPYIITLEAPRVNNTVLQFEDSATVTWDEVGDGSVGDPRKMTATAVIPKTFPLFSTAGRPTAASVGDGGAYYDTTLNKPGWSDGAVWRDATGAAM